MQVLLGTLAFLFGLFLCGGLLLLVCPCHYFIEGNKQEKFWGVLAVRVGFLKLCLTKEKKGKDWLEVYVLGWKLIDTQGQEGKKKKEKRLIKEKIFQEKKEKVQKPRRRFFNRQEIFIWRELLEREIFDSMVELCKKVWPKIHPRTLLLQGKMGFADPYYTGLLAAVLYGFSRENVNLEPDFSRPICEFTLQIEGQVFLGLLFYYLLCFLLRRPLRSKVWGKLKKCKTKNVLEEN